MQTLVKRDKKLIWHPFTQEKTATDVLPIKRAEGPYVYGENNEAYLDLISSWWVNIHGHSHPEIAKAIYDQALKLEHIIFAGFTHDPAVKLCEKLNAILPDSLGRFFFSDNGSTAVEVALKMSYQYWVNQGQSEKKYFLSFDGGYHGDTFGAMSVGQKSGFHEAYSKLLFEVLSLSYPETWDDDQDILRKENEALLKLDTYLSQYKGKISALIVEPLIQGASGMRMCRPEFLKLVIDKIRAQDILVIFDEVMTGFGRTGTNFALEQVGVVPDFLCISKGITGGFLPLSLTVTSENIYEAFLDDSFDKAFAHGHSYTANPIACAAAICSLDILLSKETQDALKTINEAHMEGVKLLKERCAFIEKTRIIGTICAFNVPDLSKIKEKLKKRFLGQGLLIRPLGDTIYILPPYVTTRDQLQFAYEKIADVLLAEVGRYKLSA